MLLLCNCGELVSAHATHKKKTLTLSTLCSAELCGPGRKVGEKFIVGYHQVAPKCSLYFLSEQIAEGVKFKGQVNPDRFALYTLQYS